MPSPDNAASRNASLLFALNGPLMGTLVGDARGDFFCGSRCQTSASLGLG